MNRTLTILALCAAALHAPDNAHEIDITIPPGCTAGDTGEDEHFPAYVCPDGTAFYYDMDGDGIHAETVGRLLPIDPRYVR